MPERTYTTHDIARFCDVYPSSIVHWINGGKLKAYQTAGGHHRVTKDDLVAFLRSLNIPLPVELVSRRRVLIVDDDVEVARVIERAFARRAEHFQTRVCHNGIEALISIGQEPPDLVILDIVMPKMDGIQVCRVLKSKDATRRIKIVAITGQKTPGADKKLEEIKVDAVFAKPLDIVALLAKSAELFTLELGARK